MVAATSLLPYMQTIEDAREWVAILNISTSFSDICRELFLSLSSNGGPLILATWGGLSLLAIGLLLYLHRPTTTQRRNHTQKDVVLFCVAIMVICTAVQVIFLMSMQVYITPWYYLALMAITAVCLDAIFGCLKSWSIMRIVLAILIAATTSNTARQGAHERKTNIDLVASVIEQSAQQGDVVVVDPWFLGSSFLRYYHGKAPFTTLPPIDDYHITRYDLVRERMISTDPIGPVLSKVSVALQSGHEVWIVGWMPPLFQYGTPQSLAPAPHSPSGWYVGAYTTNWSQQLLDLLRTHGVRNSVFPPVTDRRVNPFEDCSVWTIRGWQ
jgi:hypothetical protein